VGVRQGGPGSVLEGLQESRLRPQLPSTSEEMGKVQEPQQRIEFRVLWTRERRDGKQGQIKCREDSAGILILSVVSVCMIAGCGVAVGGDCCLGLLALVLLLENSSRIVCG